ncbi:MAG: DUF4384 domain-containing protein, partial [Armatimonadetes bacterium]|nr:DUF4384 domain-containing protein [Armatimonadota bacterium]
AAARGAAADGVLIYSPNAGRMFLKLFSPAGGFLGQAVAERTSAAVGELTPLLAREWMIKRAVGLEPPEAPFRLSLADPRAGNPSYQVGDEIRLRLTSTRPASVVLLNVEATGQVTLLLPNGYQPAPQVTPEAPCLLPEPGGLALTADGPPGPQYFLAVATAEPLDLPELRLDDLNGRPFRRLAPLAGVSLLNKLAAALEKRPNGYATADLLALVKVP